MVVVVVVVVVVMVVYQWIRDGGLTLNPTLMIKEVAKTNYTFNHCRG